MKQCIMIDLDGTLLKPDKTVGEKTKAVIRQYKNDHQIVISTGRPLPAVKELLEELGLWEEGQYVVTYNGGRIDRLGANPQVLKNSQLDKEELAPIWDFAKKEGLSFHLVNESAMYYDEKNTDPFYRELNAKMEQVAMSELPTGAFNKVVLVGDKEMLPLLAKKGQEELPQYLWLQTMPNLLEVSSKEVGKEQALQFLQQELGLKKEQMVAIGDEENDRLMLEQAGLGIAMGNAKPEIKKIADVITASNADEGVAEAFLRWI